VAGALGVEEEEEGAFSEVIGVRIEESKPGKSWSAGRGGVERPAECRGERGGEAACCVPRWLTVLEVWLGSGA
jgi:hypothetical protein